MAEFGLLKLCEKGGPLQWQKCQFNLSTKYNFVKHLIVLVIVWHLIIEVKEIVWEGVGIGSGHLCLILQYKNWGGGGVGRARAVATFA